MVTIKEIEKGAARYIDAEMAPKIPTDIQNGQLKKIAAISGAVYALRHGLQNLAASPVIAAIGAMDEKGNIDVEGLAEVAKGQIPADGFKVTVPILGDLTFFSEDVDKLLQYIEEA